MFKKKKNLKAETLTSPRVGEDEKNVLSWGKCSLEYIIVIEDEHCFVHEHVQDVLYICHCKVYWLFGVYFPLFLFLKIYLHYF